MLSPGLTWNGETPARDALERALKADSEAGVWDHLAGTVSALFVVKVIDDRGDELLVVKHVRMAKATR